MWHKAEVELLQVDRVPLFLRGRRIGRAHEHVRRPVRPLARLPVQWQLGAIQTQVDVVLQQAPIDAVGREEALDYLGGGEGDLAVAAEQTPERTLVAGKLVSVRAEACILAGGAQVRVQLLQFDVNVCVR